MASLFKYELTPSVAKYLLDAVNALQGRGKQFSKDLLAVCEILENPLNKDEFEKEKFEELKLKYEPIAEKEEDKK